MSRIRFMSPYLKGGRDAAKLANRTRYVATRPGVEVPREEHGDRPATKKQQESIRRSLREFPDAQELLEYEDYQSNPTRETASVFIQQVREDFVGAMSQRENYLDYVAHRPGVELQGEHGLWGPGGKVQNLSRAIGEVADPTGNVWTPVVAIRREDAERLGYDTAENWRALVNACLSDIAKGYKISPDHLRWYAAFHGKEQCVHIHMVVFSSDPKEGYLTKQGIQQVKSAFALRIFRDDLFHVYEQKTEYRASTQREARLAMEELIRQMRNGNRDNPDLEQLTTALALRLQTTKGKKVYGYLPPKTKAIVDEIVDELARDERVAAAYDLWYQMQEEICRTYSQQPPRRVPLSQQKEFKAVRNMVIQEALRLSQTESISEDLSRERAEIPNTTEPPNTQTDGKRAETPKKDDSIRPAAPERSKPSGQEKEPAVVAAVSRMFYHMGRIFEDRCMTDTMQRGLQIDRKRQRQLLEKKIAMGHKADDHENEEIQLK